jgi:hypothetical protein
MAYEALLDRVLKDRLLDDFKADTLLPTAARWGLSNDQARLAHHGYLNKFAVATVADGTIAEAERRDLSLSHDCSVSSHPTWTRYLVKPSQRWQTLRSRRLRHSKV